jgi:signal transduction histidine kinase
MRTRTLRRRLALTVLATGVVTALGVLVMVALVLQRFEHESAWQRADAFVGRVARAHPDLLEQHRRSADELADFMRTLVLYDPDNRLYLLDADGTVLVSTGARELPPGFKVALAPVREAAARAAAGQRASYVMGDDPEQMTTDAVVAARPLTRAVIRPEREAAGWLYIVCRKQGLPGPGRLRLLGASLASPALLPVAALVCVASLIAAWIIVTVTRPLRVLADEVQRVATGGFASTELPAAGAPGDNPDDEIGRLRGGFATLLATLRRQWDELKRLDGFRRESVSNLSHDLRSPLTATAACLETLQGRWAGDPARADDAALLAVAQRNTLGAARLVRALGDLAQLDEPSFVLNTMRVDLGELLDDIVQRFQPRAAQQGVGLVFEQRGEAAPVAAIDTELFERALANVLDNAFKATPAGGAVTLSAERGEAVVRIAVADSGHGIAPDAMPHLFDRHYQARQSVAPASSDEGKGLGLAIVQRIAELHGGSVAVSSELGRGTTVTLELPAA